MNIPRLSLDMLSDAHLQRIGHWFHTEKDFAMAALFFNESLERGSKDALALSNMGATLFDLNQTGEARRFLKRAIDEDHTCVLAWYTLGAIAKKEHEYDSARSLFARALSHATTSQQQFGQIIHTQLGIVEQWLGSFDAAAAHFQYALLHSPRAGRPQAHLGMVQMLHGDYQQGLWNYEGRLQDFAWMLPSKPVWNRDIGGLPKSCTRLFVIAEQGQGDTIQFARYGQAVKQAFPHVHLTLAARSQLTDILGFWPGWDLLLSEKDQYVDDTAFDMQIALMSLPLLLHQAGYNPPAASNFPSTYRRNIPIVPHRIGICWRGSSAHPNDQERSIPLIRLKKLFDVDCEWVSFQLDQTAEEVAMARFNGGAPQSSWMATAQEMWKCQLIISVDTAVAHVAASIGVQTWILLANPSDWRWGLTGDTTPWYDSARLFRQPKFRDWDSVVDQVAEALKKEVAP